MGGRNVGRLPKKTNKQSEFFTIILNSLSYPFYVIDANDYMIKMANKAAKLGDLSKKGTCYALIHKRDEPCKGVSCACPLEEVKRTGRSTVVEHIHHDEDGNVRYVEIHGHPVFDTEGNVTQMIEHCFDITEHKQAEHYLRERVKELRIFYGIADIAGKSDITSDELYQQITDLIPQGWQYPEITGARITINGKEFKTKNYEETEWKQSSYIKAGGSIVGSVDILYLEEKSEIDEGPFAKEERLLIDAVAERLGKITERKKLEEVLWESEKFSFSLLKNAPNPILVVNPDKTVKYVNSALEKLTGFSSTEIIGRKPPFPWWPEETLKLDISEFNEVLRSKEVRKLKKLFKKKSGERFWVEINSTTVSSYGGCEYHLSSWVDITEERRLRENMEFYISEITRAQEEERRRIAREIHDESVQSLASLAHKIEALATKKGRLPEDIVQYVEGLCSETKGIMDGLRRFSHELRPGVLDQVGLGSALELLVEELSKDQYISTSLDISGSERRLKPEVELTLFRIAQEALSNMKRHSEAKKVAIKLLFTSRKVKLTVSDDGRGFQLPEVLGDLATEGKLGLVGMQERTRLLNGKFSIKSIVGKGTKVVVEVSDEV
jgi:PAS domain S-box-containing protein